MLMYGELVSNRAEFETKVISICKKLGIQPDWLMATMYIECTMDHTAVNVKNRATGLIQFTPSTALSLGTSVEALKAMTNIEQLDYVYKYLKPYALKIKSFVDCYFAVFFPAAIGQYSDYVLQTMGLSARYVASLNGGYDLNNDNQLTFREVETKVLLAIDPKYRAQLISEKVPVIIKWDFQRIVFVLLAVGLLAFGGYSLFKIFKK